MRIALAVLFFALTLGLTPLSARVGETLDQCRQRYGKAISVPAPYDFGNEAPDLIYYDFEKNGIAIEIGFLKGKAADLSFHHAAEPSAPPAKPAPNEPPAPLPPTVPPAPLTQTEIDVLLAANSAGLPWKTIGDGKLTFFPDTATSTSTRYGTYQLRDDGVKATVDGTTLHIFTPEWMTYINDQMKTHSDQAIEDQKKNLEGF